MLLDHTGRPIASTKPTKAVVRAKYDAASGGDDNARHWANADALSAVSANSAYVRAKLRERSRYECANNSYARGIVDTISDYLVGSGPSLNLSFRTEFDKSVTREVETKWQDWAYSVGLSAKLHQAATALTVDGEAFGMMTSTVRPNSPVQLDVRLYECDHFDSLSLGGLLADDAGVQIDNSGLPIAYAFSDVHPGDSLSYATSSRWVSAQDVLHVFRASRPGQLRGIPRTTPALPLFAQLRRFTLATIVAAESAANIAGVLSQDIGGGDERDNLDLYDHLSIERGTLLTLPEQTKLFQLKAEHPNATYDEFVRAILREIARCLNVPAVMALLDASQASYSSGRLDIQAFHRAMDVDRAILFERLLLDRLLEAWLFEASLIDGFLPDEFVEALPALEWTWRWQSGEHVDRKKNADGQAAELENNLTTLSREYGRQGLDWEVELRQRARELALMNELGLGPNAVRPSSVVDDEEQEEEQE